MSVLTSDHYSSASRNRRFAIALLTAFLLVLGLAPFAAANASTGAHRGHGSPHHGRGASTFDALERSSGQTGVIEGTVRTDGEVPLGYSGRRVVLRDAATNRLVDAVWANRSGDYAFTRLSGGSYRVAFNRLSGEAFYAAQFYNHRPETEEFDPVTLHDGGLEAGVDADLVRGGSFTGQLRDTEGRSLAGCEVQAFDPTHSMVTRTAYSDGDGDFAIGGLSSGSYLVRVTAGRGDCVGPVQFYDGDDVLSTHSDDAEQATSTTGADNDLGTLQYVIGARIAGHVSFPHGAVDGDRVVTLLSPGGGTLQHLVDDSGNFSFSRLAGGTYQLAFDRASGQAFAAPQFYDGVTEGEGVASADEIVLDEGEDADDINATLVEGGSLSGRLRDNAGRSLQGCSVRAYTNDGSLVTRTSSSDEDGDFTIGGLSTGSYRIAVTGSGECDSGEQYYVSADGVLSRHDHGILVEAELGESQHQNLVYDQGEASHVPDPPVQQSVANLSAPTLSGTPQVGATLTADPGTWSPGTVTFAYRWLVGDELVDGATGPTYVPVAGDIGKTVRVRVVASAPGYLDSQAESGPTAAVVAAVETVTNVVRPSIAGVVQVGQTVRADPGSWTPDGLSFAYQWSVGGVAVNGADTSTFLIPGSAAGKTVSVTVTATGAGLSAVSATSPATSTVAKGLLTLDRKPQVHGKARVGKILTATPGRVRPAAVTTTYGWLRDRSRIAGATKAHYRVTNGDVAHWLRVVVTYSVPGYRDLTVMSSAKWVRR